MDQARSFTVDCDECVMRRTEVCADCIVTFVCHDGEPLVLDLSEARAVRLLAHAGLVSPLRHRRAAADR